MLLARWAITLRAGDFGVFSRGEAGDADYLVKRHLRPTPRILQGRYPISPIRRSIFPTV